MKMILCSPGKRAAYTSPALNSGEIKFAFGVVSMSSAFPSDRAFSMVLQKDIGSGMCSMTSNAKIMSNLWLFLFSH